MRLRRPGEIDYYEELGVNRNAVPAEIRDSFRALARLLHPDHQQDEHLKVIAERQLRRVNRIYAVLSDPERRRRYDELLDDDFRPPAVIFKAVPANLTAKQLISRFVWIGVAVLGVAMVVWLATEQPSAPAYFPDPAIVSARPRVPASPVAAEGKPQSDSPDEMASLRAELRATRLERDDAQRELARLRSPHTGGAAPALLSPQAAPASVPANLADLSPPRIVPPESRLAMGPASPALRSPRPSGGDAHQFAGFWYFARAAGQRPKNLYPPEFIEATLTEQNGVVHGKYRSRYEIVDRAISPDVNFEFTGTPNGATIDCTWSGNGGARGAITLHMTDDNDLKVDWNASEIGSVQGLASGTAVLTRRLE